MEPTGHRLIWRESWDLASLMFIKGSKTEAKLRFGRDNKGNWRTQVNAHHSLLIKLLRERKEEIEYLAKYANRLQSDVKLFIEKSGDVYQVTAAKVEPEVNEKPDYLGAVRAVTKRFTTRDW